MKIISLFFLLILSNAFGAELNWPNGHYNIDSINSGFFGRLNSYMKIIRTKNPFRMTPNGFYIYHHRNNQPIVKASYKISNGFTYLVYKSRNQKFIIKVKNSDERIARNLLSFDFNDILQGKEFNIQMPSADLRFIRKHTSAGELMSYWLDWGKLSLLETKTQESLKSRFWIQCERCSGENLTFVMKQDGDSFKRFYFLGKLQEEVSPKTFYQLANRWYLPGITEYVESIIFKLQKRYGWPSER
ncbi:MAG: hypothetical protein ACJAS4_001910 [Bacteriovoracaceae bacterium]